ncbi:uncharacterized protein BT62DRAFT_930142 [Guyanagaster necrorhizus]|uniref:Uncharacterized protein n=1 Tax=Guyanagaster necrorhizus TaxID=856835 RepID=A0A9P8AVM5_9AGAR|nr:uncharacterized protein BT62DRAFT_930142 [Guyanagaster necrorhizus MCA 3950]KAG7448057.1 hypothetical protein BT62DRAFT_930142 [Guyanagaster necrorhizus MCA 3950]
MAPFRAAPSTTHKTQRRLYSRAFLAILFYSTSSSFLFQLLNPTDDLQYSTAAGSVTLDEVPLQNPTLIESRITGTNDHLILILSMRAFRTGGDKRYRSTLKTPFARLEKRRKTTTTTTRAACCFPGRMSRRS